MFFRDEELGVSGERKNKDCVEGQKMSRPEDGTNKWRLEKPA